MLALGVFQALLNGIGWILAWIYDLVGNYGLSILVLTVVIKVVLLPLGVKQIKSMQAMQSIQPKVKELQKKFKGNKEKIQQETMKLYKEAGVNPLGGCLPLLLQFPILIAMYAVIRAPQLQPVDTSGQPVASTVVVDGKTVPNTDLAAYKIHNSHLPTDSKLLKDVMLHQNLGFLGMNLQCSASQSGTQAKIAASDRGQVQPNIPILDADGNRAPVRRDDRHGRSPVRLEEHGQDPVLRTAHLHGGNDVLSATSDAEREPSGIGERPAAGDPQDHAADVRGLGLHVPGRTHPVLDDLQPLADRAAVRPAQGRPYRAGRDGASDRRAARQEREQARQARASWPGCRSVPSRRSRPGAASRPRSRPGGRSLREAPARGQARVPNRRAAGRTPVAPRSRVAPRRPGDDPTRIRASAVEVAVARETEKRAPSVEEAVEAALHELGVSEQEAQIDVLQEPRTGVLGIGSHEAVVRVRVTTPDVDPEDLEEQADTAADFLEELMGHMGIDAVAEPNLHHDHMYVDIVGEDEDDMALLIGRHGQTLDAIQELTRMVVGRRLDERVRVIVDVEDYRKRRETRLEEKAREAAERVLRHRHGRSPRADEPVRAEDRPRCGVGDRRRRELQQGRRARALGRDPSSRSPPGCFT